MVTTSVVSVVLSTTATYLDEYLDRREHSTRTTLRLQRCLYVLEDVLNSNGLASALTGLAFFVSALVTYGTCSNDAHAKLAFTLSLLVTCSQLPTMSLLTVWSAEKRGLAMVYALLYMSQGYIITFATADELMGLVACLSLMVQVLNMMPRVAGNFLATCPVLCTLLSGVVPTIALLFAAFALKFSHNGCDMNTGEDNQWSLGQTSAMLVLVIPLVSAYLSYLSKCTVRTCSFAMFGMR